MRLDAGGVVRIGNSRVTLDVVIGEYENGMAPEEMVRAYDTLCLADVYAVIGWYLRHREEVAEFLKQRELEADVLREKLDARRTPITRAELLAREKADASAGQ